MANPFCHIELNTDNTAAAKAFYGSVFDWSLQDMPMGPGITYTMVNVGTGTGGGMQDKNAIGMSAAPTMWLPYVLVDDVKKTIAKAKKAGAQIIVEHQEVPGMGSLGILVDPTGAAVGVWEAAAGQQPAAEAAAAEKAPEKAPRKAAKKAAKKPAKKVAKKATKKAAKKAAPKAKRAAKKKTS